MCPAVDAADETGALPEEGADTATGDGVETEPSDATPSSVDFLEPASPVIYTNGAVAVEIAASPAQPDVVDVLIDGTVVARLPAPFQSSLPTASVSEGPHTLECRAVIAGRPVACTARTVVVDRTPPVVLSTTPFPNAYARSGEPISVTFNEPIAGASVSAAAFAVFVASDALPTSPSLSSGGKTLTAGISSHPMAGDATAIVRRSVTDLAGNPLGADQTWNWRWANAVSLGGALPALVGEAGGLAPAIAVGPDGLPVVAWTTEGIIAPTRVIVQRWNGVSWTAVGSFQEAPNLQIFQLDPNVAVDRDGRMLVGWTTQDNIAGTFSTHVRVQDGSGWDAWDDLPAGIGPQLVVDDAGTVSLAMTVIAPTRHTVVFRRVGVAWQPLGDLMVGEGEQLSCGGNLAGDADGTLEVLWCDQVGSDQFVPRVRLWQSATTGWQSQSLPPVSGLGPLEILIGMNRAGATAFTWTEAVSPSDPLTVAVFVPGWADRRMVDGFSGVYASDIDVDIAGRPIVTFSRLTPRTLQVERWSGTGWEMVFDSVRFDPAREAVAGRLVLDDAGKPFVAIAEHAAGHGQVYVITQP